MRHKFVPHQSSAHRIACISLFRSLLRQCDELAHTTASHGQPRSSPFPSAILKDIIRFRFRRDGDPARLLPRTAIANALQTGHEHLALLRNATIGDPPALSRLITLLKATSDDLAIRASWATENGARARPMSRTLRYRLRHEHEVRSKTLQTPPVDAPLAAHPLPASELSRQRRVPHLVVTSVGNIPLLRYKTGRAPPWMRRIVRQKQMWMTRQFEKVQEMEYVRGLGYWEDEWEKMVWTEARRQGCVSKTGQLLKVQRHTDDMPTWSWNEAFGDSYSFQAAAAKAHLWNRFHDKIRQHAVKGWELWQIVKREKWLADREGLPQRVASAVRAGQWLQEQLRAWAHEHGRSFPEGRSAKESKALARDAADCGPLHVPVEWSEVVVERERPAYLRQMEQAAREKQQVRRPVRHSLTNPGTKAGGSRVPGEARRSLPDGHPRAAGQRDKAL
ncbi:uncharacterized protein HMPREF1541_08555 [Cyphellophora europaea CBS 101466]|uniref:Uncharacterized protein n=1 Tax=Cyphellophora europaea (strain CBS 101466) TaxID=1220924 RepID=W2RKN5_CYPE1|nr:uncharacterized protein HMPREF1541_08555 [Cyphellophora europaea CBS 101466]ETN36278.1 hypothetical protein HMPREF1541_08555 [Cyphellophora europaea CBS 101466]